MRARHIRSDEGRPERGGTKRTFWVVALSVVLTAGACAGTVVGLFGPSTLSRAWDGAHDNRQAACTALAKANSEADRAISLGETDADESYAYWAYSWATARSDESYTHSGSPEMQTFVLKVQDALAHMNAICASWGLR